MDKTVALPLWFVILAGTLALIGIIDRLLVPSMRWYLKKRMHKTLDELNTRLKLRIQPFKMTNKDSLADRIIFDSDISRAIEEEAIAKKIPREVVFERVRSYAKEIVPSFSANTYFKVGARGARMLSQALYTMRLGYSHDDALAKIDPDATVVFVINHRSNMDYVLVTFLASASSALSYAVGEWARVIFLQQLIKSMGAYFIRRNSGDPLYRKVLAKYVQIATQEGVTQAVFPEGGLTRDGALQPAKLGLLSYIIGKFDPKGARDVVFIPVGLNYDRVLEDRNLTAQIAKKEGTPHRRRGVWALMKYFSKVFTLRLSGKWFSFGLASVSFGEPLSMRAYLSDKPLDVEAIGKELMTRIGRIIPVLPLALVCEVFEQARGGTLTLIEVKTKAANLIAQLESRAIPQLFSHEEMDGLLEQAVQSLLLRQLIHVDEDEDVFTVTRENATLVRYYANSIKHHFG